LLVDSDMVVGHFVWSKLDLAIFEKWLMAGIVSMYMYLSMYFCMAGFTWIEVGVKASVLHTKKKEEQSQTGFIFCHDDMQ